VIEVPEPGRDIPFGDGSVVTMSIGDNVTAASDTNITISCPVSGVPTPVVTWTKDGVPIVDGGRIIFAENNTLVMEHVELDDSAKYTCSAQNLFGKDEASSIVRIIGLCTEHLLKSLCSLFLKLFLEGSRNLIMERKSESIQVTIVNDVLINEDPFIS